MADRANKERDLFLAALEQGTPAAMAAFLDEACAGDAALRRRVETLLRAHDQPDGLLDQPAIAVDSVTDSETLQGEPVRIDGLPGGLAPSQDPGSLGRLDHYEVLEVVGRGGMGVVLRARDTKLHRVVAIKVLAPQIAANAAARQRILREAQAAAAVCDDHVVGIHEVQKDSKLPYLVMEFVGGTTLEERVRTEGAMGVKEVLRIALQVARGLVVAHAQGLVHRDIKPSNILLQNGVQRVKITDFGLARASDDYRLTHAGLIAGTPQYMAPEQARGEAVDPRADLFSLGSVMYMLCTGAPPFQAKHPLAVLRQVCDATPRPIRALNPDIPPALCAVIERLHAKDPAARFQTATALADVLSQMLAELQQPCARPGPVMAARPWRRPRAGFWFAAGFVPVAVLAVLVPGWLRPPAPPTPAAPPNHTDVMPDQPFSAPLDARKREDLPLELLALAGAGDPTQAPAELVAVLGSPRLQHRGVVEEMVFLDGETLVTADWTGALTWWDAASGNLRRRLPHVHAKWIRGLALSPDGKRLATGGTDGASAIAGRVCLWDTQTGEHLQTIPFPLHVLSLAFSPDGKWLAVGSGNNPLADTGIGRWLAIGAAARFAGRITLLESATAKVIHTFPASTHHWIQQLTFSPDSQLLAVAGHDTKVRLFDPATSREVRSWKGHDEPIDRVAFAAQGNYLATGAEDGTVRIWDVATGAKVRALGGHRSSISGVRFSADDRWLATADTAGEVRLWDVATGEERFVRMGHHFHNPLVFHPTNHTLAAVDAGKSVQYWHVPSGERSPLGPGHVGAVHAIAVSQNGRWLASGGADGTAQLWDLHAWKADAPQPPVQVLRGHSADVWSVAFRPDSSLLATGSLDGTLALWDPMTGRLVRRLEGYSQDRSALAFSVDGATLAAGSADGAVNVWEVKTGRPLSRRPGQAGVVRSVAFSPDGRWLASASTDGTVWLRAADTGLTRHVFRMGAPCVHIAFSPDSQAIAAVTDAPHARVTICDLATGHTQVLAGQKITAVTFHPTGQYLATGASDGMVGVWDQTSSGVRTRPWGPGGASNSVTGLACTPDGRYLATAGAGGTVTILRIPATAGAFYPGRRATGSIAVP